MVPLPLKTWNKSSFLPFDSETLPPFPISLFPSNIDMKKAFNAKMPLRASSPRPLGRKIPCPLASESTFPEDSFSPPAGLLKPPNYLPYLNHFSFPSTSLGSSYHPPSSEIQAVLITFQPVGRFLYFNTRLLPFLWRV